MKFACENDSNYKIFNKQQSRITHLLQRNQAAWIPQALVLFIEILIIINEVPIYLCMQRFVFSVRPGDDAVNRQKRGLLKLQSYLVRSPGDVVENDPG